MPIVLLTVGTLTSAYAQPSTKLRNIEAAPGSGYTVLTGADGKQYYVAASNGAIAVNNTPIGYVPSASGNPSNNNEIVIDPNGDIWVIDSSGDGIKISAVITGAETKVSAGTGVSVSGSGTTGDPYVVTSTITQADGSETAINAGSNVTISGSGTAGDPYVISATGGGGGADGDSLWNHTTLQNIDLDSFWLSPDGTSRGLQQPASGGYIYESLVNGSFRQKVSLSNTFIRSGIVDDSFLGSEYMLIKDVTDPRLDLLFNSTANWRFFKDHIGLIPPASDPVDATFGDSYFYLWPLRSGSAGTGVLQYKDGVSGDIKTVATTDNITPTASVETLDTALTFTYSKFYYAYSATDSVIFTADTTNGIYGAYTIARVDFDTVPVLFNGTAFDSVQFYNIASGDTLQGVHMLYFENTPYGVAVSVPTNSRTIQDTLSGGGSSSPAQGISGLLAEWDGQTDLSSASTTTTWVDQSSFSRSAANTIASRQPTVTASGAEFMDDSNPDALVFSPSVTIPSTYSMTASFTVDDAGRDQMFWGKTGSSGDYIMYRNSGITTNNFHYKTAVWSVPTLTTTAYIAQISCASGSCELWINGISYGTATAPSSTTYDVLGNFSDNSASQSLNGTFHYLSLHGIEYSTQNRTDIYDYINTRFSLGL